jgi:hypothetical protein
LGWRWFDPRVYRAEVASCEASTPAFKSKRITLNAQIKWRMEGYPAVEIMAFEELWLCMVLF